MKKFITTSALITLGVVSVAAQTTLFSSDFNTQEDFDRWTVVDANEDGYTWAWYKHNDDHITASIRWNSSLASNDWLISPAITSPKKGTYMLSVIYGGGNSSHEKLDICSGASADAAAMTTVLQSLTDITGSEYHTVQALLTLQEGETIHLGMHAISPADQYRIYIDDVQLNEIESATDLGVTAILSPISGENLAQEPVKIQITNSGLETISSLPVGFSINGDTIATETCTESIAPNQTIEYTFATKADMSVAHKTYTVSAWTALQGDIIPGNDACTVKIRHIGAASTPYSTGFENADDNETIAFFDLNNDATAWEVYVGSGFFSMARTGSACLTYAYNKTNSGDDWAILEPIHVEPGYYSLKFWYSGMNQHNERLKVCYGNSQDPSAMTNTIVEYNPFNISEYVESANVLHFDKAQDIFIGFYAFSDKDENWILIDDLTLEAISPTMVDIAVSGISNPELYMRGQNNDVKFTLSNNGISDVNSNPVIVTMDDKVLLDSLVNIKAQATIDIVLKDALATLAVGKHTITVSFNNDKDTNSSNNTVTREFNIVADPVAFWDFENHEVVNGENVYQRPTDLVFLNEDGGTLNPQVAEYFPDTLGWGPVEIDTHKIYGNCMMGVTSYLNGVSQANRWCIFPQVKITSEDAHFVWSANSMDANYPENYKIMVSDTIFNPTYYFETALEVDNEPATTVQTRGISLSEYVGKDVYVAIRLISRNAYILTLDNVGFYGQGISTITGIKEVSKDEDSSLSLTISDDLLSCDQDVKSISIFNIEGEMLSKSQGNTARISNLASGIYVASMTTDKGTVSRKFVIR